MIYDHMINMTVVIVINTLFTFVNKKNEKYVFFLQLFPSLWLYQRLLANFFLNF